MQLPLVSSLIHYFKVFYGYAGKKLYILCLLILLGGISEGFGILMLLPVLNIDKQAVDQDGYSQTIYHFLESIGIGVSLPPLLFLLFIAFSLKGVFLFLQEGLSTFITTNLVKTIRMGFCNKYRDMKYNYYTDVSIGYLNNIITTETDRAVSGLGMYARVIVSVIFITVYVSSAFIINWKMTFLVLLICSLFLLMMRYLSRISRRLSILVSGTNAQIQSILIQTIYNLKYLKATDTFTNLFKQVNKKIDENRVYKFKLGIFNAIPSSIIEPASVLLLSGLILYYVGFQGKSIAEVMILLLFFYKAFSRVFRFQADWQKFNSGVGGIEVIKTATKELNFNKELSGTKKIIRFENKISLTDINFGYSSRQALFNMNISMTIPRSKSIGIVGASGAGKTTLFDIITGLLIPQSGKICIDGVDYKELDISSIRGKIGYITQEPVIFNDTIANNISFWECDNREDLCRRKIEDAAKLANCDRFINETEKGYDTVIGDKGVKLSGGQRQRIAIARELFKEPEIMIFDEATSALDTESEQLIQQSINSLKGERTIVIIAHRLSTVRNCDCIHVLKDGRIVEEGCFDELYGDKKSRFYSMCQAQKL